jgi:hypothetical protein
VLTAEQVMNGLGKHRARLETNEQVTLRTVSSHNLFTFGSAFTVHVKQYLAQCTTHAGWAKFILLESLGLQLTVS